MSPTPHGETWPAHRLTGWHPPGHGTWAIPSLPLPTFPRTQTFTSGRPAEASLLHLPHGDSMRTAGCLRCQVPGEHVGADLRRHVAARRQNRQQTGQLLGEDSLAGSWRCPRSSAERPADCKRALPWCAPRGSVGPLVLLVSPRKQGSTPGPDSGLCLPRASARASSHIR